MRENHVGGYTRVGLEEGDETCCAGLSIYSAAWPLLQEYPGHEFQSGLKYRAELISPEEEVLWKRAASIGGSIYNFSSAKIYIQIGKALLEVGK
ncbi:MAG: hypothetical protein QF473_23750 [Planctomycetota bacterium]|nr:hypothetical protein [Planctomycetota bacterium]